MLSSERCKSVSILYILNIAAKCVLENLFAKLSFGTAENGTSKVQATNTQSPHPHPGSSKQLWLQLGYKLAPRLAIALSRSSAKCGRANSLAESACCEENSALCRCTSVCAVQSLFPGPIRISFHFELRFPRLVADGYSILEIRPGSLCTSDGPRKRDCAREKFIQWQSTTLVAQPGGKPLLCVN